MVIIRVSIYHAVKSRDISVPQVRNNVAAAFCLSTIHKQAVMAAFNKDAVSFAYIQNMKGKRRTVGTVGKITKAAETEDSVPVCFRASGKEEYSKPKKKNGGKKNAAANSANLSAFLFHSELLP
jgi:hypothetical protein